MGTRRNDTNEPHALYRFFDADGALLYIGLTADPGRRWKSHEANQPWWHLVRRAEMEMFPSREAVRAAEKAAIVAECPKYNVAHSKHPQPRRQGPLRAKKAVSAIGAEVDLKWTLNDKGRLIGQATVLDIDPASEDANRIQVQHQYGTRLATPRERNCFGIDDGAKVYYRRGVSYLDKQTVLKVHEYVSPDVREYAADMAIILY